MTDSSSTSNETSSNRIEGLDTLLANSNNKDFIYAYDKYCQGKIYVSYILESDCKKRTYLGITNDLHHRLRQHNGFIKGGARQTTSGRPWSVKAMVGPFLSLRDVLRFEKQGHLMNGKRRRGKITKRWNESALDFRLRQVATVIQRGHRMPPYAVCVTTCSSLIRLFLIKN